MFSIFLLAPVIAVFVAPIQSWPTSKITQVPDAAEQSVHVGASLGQALATEPFVDAETRKAKSIENGPALGTRERQRSLRGLAGALLPETVTKLRRGIPNRERIDVLVEDMRDERHYAAIDGTECPAQYRDFVEQLQAGWQLVMLAEEHPELAKEVDEAMSWLFVDRAIPYGLADIRNGVWLFYAARIHACDRNWLETIHVPELNGLPRCRSFFEEYFQAETSSGECEHD